MKYEIVYDIDYAALYEIVKTIQERYERELDRNGSYLQEAVHTAGDHVTQEWLNVAAGKFKHSEGGYARGIVEGIKYPFQGDPLYYKIVHTKDYAKYLEHGYEPFDMKKALQTSDKVRISKDGKRYLVIPFEHGTPSSKSKRAMPQEIYGEAKRLKTSVIAGKYNEGSIRQAVTLSDAALLRKNNPKRVQRNGYEWGEKLNIDYPLERSEGKVSKVYYQDIDKTFKIYSRPHQNSIYQGMIRIEANPNVNREKFDFGKFGYKNETSNSMQHSLYMTFRVMVEGADGWVNPGLKPMRILGETYDNTKQSVEMMLAEAAKKDIAKILPNIT